MIDQSKQSTTLKVCLDDAGTHNRAILDFFFAKIGQHIFRCVDNQQEANVLLIDYDFPPARKRYEEAYQQWQKPALVLSIAEVSLENSIWLAKPLTSRALLDAAATLQQQLAAGNSQGTIASNQQVLEPISFKSASNPVLQRPPIQKLSTPTIIPLVNKAGTEVQSSETSAEAAARDLNTNVSSSNKGKLADGQYQVSEKPAADIASDFDQDAITDETILLLEAKQAKRILLLCGDDEDIDVTVNFNDLQKDDSFFLSSLKDAVRLARQCQQGVLLNFPSARIYVLPEIHRIFCGIDIHKEEFTEFIANCNVREGGKMHILSTREIHELNDMISQQASALYDLESFVWTSTLLSAQGSLPRALDPKKTVGLKHWPSLTRLENFPNVMPIAAQWSYNAMSAFDVAKSLNIPQRHVFSFYNAANSLGLIEQDPQKLINKQSVPRSKDAPRGLFSRLLKRLVGG